MTHAHSHLRVLLSVLSESAKCVISYGTRKKRLLLKFNVKKQLL